jgi:hypothetical protein
MTADDDVDERWMMYAKLSLHPVVKEFTGCSIEEKGCHVRVDLVAVIQGFVLMWGDPRGVARSSRIYEI